MKRTRVGGAVAAVANKNGLGRVVKAFPPSAMLSEGERAKALEIMRKGRKAKREPANGAAKFLADVQAMPSQAVVKDVMTSAAQDRELLLSIAKDHRVPEDVRLRVFEALL